MEGLLKLNDGEDRDRLIYILETSLDVRKPAQFFAWTQGPLQALLPHEIVICGIANGAEPDLRMSYFTATRYFKAHHFEAACNTRNGVVSRIIRHWHNVRRPCMMPAVPGEATIDPQLDELLRRLELKNMVAHGLVSPSGNVQSWFGFCRTDDLSPRAALVLDLLMPTITSVYARILANEARESISLKRVGNLLSPRERQVLELVRDGCSNIEVAARLSLSVMTAKNHMQNIRKKLNARTRGQAVAEAMRQGFIQPAREGD